MNARQPLFERLLEAIGLLTEQIKVLVSAVDDLRSEVEWQARNSSIDPPFDESLISDSGEACSRATFRQSKESDPNSLLSSAGRLQAFEKLLCQGPRDGWRDEWTEHDDFEMPPGRVIAVAPDIWGEVLAMRPAHAIGDSCCCEEGIGAPYLLAWRTDDECLLRELTEAEASQLQRLCLAEKASARAKVSDTPPADLQLGLF